MVASAQGYDVANFQGRYNWQQAKARTPNLAFGVFRLTQGLGQRTNSPDPDSGWNHEQIAAHGLHRGAYHFLDPRLPGADQAEYFVSEYRKLGLTPTDMLWLDNETAGAGPAATSECARAFMGKLDALVPHNPRGVYTFIDFARTGYDNGLGAYPLWLAWPGSHAPSTPPPWHLWKFWQYGTRNGTDTDAFNGTAGQLDAWIASYAPKAGPYRHVASGHETLGQIAAARNTTAAHLLAVTIPHLTTADESLLASVPLPAGTPYYTSNP